MLPRVSIIVPNYNHAPFLENRIQSILSQTYDDFEIILLDDHSSDHSLEILNQYARRPRFRLMVNDRNGGNPYKQWNKGIAAARGDLIWIAESDDFASEYFLERVVALLENRPGAGLAYSQSWIIDENGRQLHVNDVWTRDLSVEHWQKDFIANGRDECRDYLIFKNTIPNASAVLFKKNLYDRIGGADETFFYAGDWHLWVRMLAVSDLCFCSEALNCYRTHAATLRKKEMAGTRRVMENYRVLEWLINHIGVPAAQAEKALDRAMERWLLALTGMTANLALGKNRPIFHIARRIDRRLYRRFVRQLSARSWKKLRGFLKTK
jgi:glycosyltransferase involved in cell wall biosynthesis